MIGMFMNECIDSAMGHIHVCLLCCLPVTIRGLVGSFSLEGLSGATDPLRHSVETDPDKGITGDDLPELDLRSKSRLCIITSLVPVWGT